MPARKPYPRAQHIDGGVIVGLGGGEQIARHRNGGGGADQADAGDLPGMSRRGLERDQRPHGVADDRGAAHAAASISAAVQSAMAPMVASGSPSERPWPSRSGASTAKPRCANQRASSAQTV